MGVLNEAWDKAAGGISFSGVGTTITILLFIFIIAVMGGVLGYLIIMAKKYKYKITIFENITGQGFTPSGKDKAMLVKFGDSGEQVLFLRKAKLYRQAYGKKIGKNHYAFAIGKDGYWYNIDFGDLDERLSQLGIEPADRDMRYMQVAIRRNIKDRYERTTFLQKYGGLLTYIGLIAMTGIMVWLLFDKYLDITQSVNAAVSTANEVMKTAKEVIGAVDSLKGSGGLQPAT